MELSTNKIGELLFNFEVAYFYTFFSGILVALAANTLTTAFFTNNLPVPNSKVCVGGIFLFMSALSAFCVSVILETARNEWESSGSPNGEYNKRIIYIESGKRKARLWLSFIFSISFLFASLLIYF